MGLYIKDKKKCSVGILHGLIRSVLFFFPQNQEVAIWSSRRKLIHESINQSSLLTHLFVKRFIRDLNVLEVQNQQVRGVGRVSASSGVTNHHSEHCPVGSVLIQVSGEANLDGSGGIAAV